MRAPDNRSFVAPDGTAYRACLAPLERPTGRVAADMNALVFETEDGRWVGSTPLYRSVRLESLTGEDLRRKLELILGRG
jgi:hypothetical protein